MLVFLIGHRTLQAHLLKQNRWDSAVAFLRQENGKKCRQRHSPDSSVSFTHQSEQAVQSWTRTQMNVKTNYLTSCLLMLSTPSICSKYVQHALHYNCIKIRGIRSWYASRKDSELINKKTHNNQNQYYV